MRDQQVRSLQPFEAEGESFPIGTVFTVEKIYPAEGESPCLLDLFHAETGVLLWADARDLEVMS